MPTQRFLQLTEVSEILNISAASGLRPGQVREPPAIKVGGRGQWRVETTELENYIQRMYSRPASSSPLTRSGRGPTTSSSDALLTAHTSRRRRAAPPRSRRVSGGAPSRSRRTEPPALR